MIFKVNHGTITEVPLWEGHVDECIKFDNLNYEHEDAKTSAVYFTNNEDVCKFFSDEKMIDSNTMMQTVITANVLAENIYTLDKCPIESHTYNGVSYEWPEDRSSLYDALRNDGYDTFVVESGYIADGVVSSDVAVLDVSKIEALTVSYKINNKWTPEMDKNSAHELLTKISQDPEMIQNSFEVSENEIDNNPLYY
jgi:hypothetical protein